MTLIRRRTGNYDLAVKIIKMITESDWVDLKLVDENTIMKAKEKYIEYEDKELSFTDWVSAVLIREEDFDGIISFDGDFDGITLNRIS